MKIGILTGGGDVPGLNPCIKAAVDRAIDEGHEVVGIRRGWGGLLQLNPADPSTYDECFSKLDKNKVRTIDRTGGTFLHTSRTNPAKVKPKDVPDFLRDPENPSAVNEKGVLDFTPHVLRNLEFLGIDRLIPIGGDDTLSYGVHLAKKGFKVVGIPKTMDNDVPGTDYCIGFSTCVSRTIALTNTLRTSAGSHERFLVLEVFGRYAGFTAMLPTMAGAANRCVIPEVKFDMELLTELLAADRHRNPSKYSILLVSEGAMFSGGEMVFQSETTDAYGHKKLGGIGQLTGEALKKLTGEDIIYQQVSYLMRSGAPDALDLMVGVNYANLAVSLLTSGVSGRMVALRDGTYTHIPMSTVTSGLKRVDVSELYDVGEYRPKVRHVLGKPMFLY
ncbi:MAG: 6-phosphofructokinase [Caldilinea sp.]|nr:6-phosphofructokinase [Caldilinea sp.]